MSKPVDGNQFFNQAEASFIQLWSSGDPAFKDLAWALLNTNKALQWALNDIHNHVRQQQSAAQSALPARGSLEFSSRLTNR